MSALWVLLELVSLGVILVLVSVAVIAGEKSRPRYGRDTDEPEWWPQFERDFALYAASQRLEPGAES